MASVALEVPDNLVAKLSSAGHDPAQTLRLAAAFSLCTRGELTVSQGARLAGLTYDEFLQASVRDKVELFPVDIEELKEEISQGFTLGRQQLEEIKEEIGRSFPRPPQRASDPPAAPPAPLLG